MTGTSEHWQAGIFDVARISKRSLTEEKYRAAVGLDAASILTIVAEARMLHFCGVGWDGHLLQIATPKRCVIVTDVFRLSLRHGYISIGIGRPDVVRARPNQPVVVELLDDMGGPSADTRHSKNRGKQIHVNS